MEAPAEPARAAALVEFQPGAIVSRTLMKNASGSATLFAFDEGQSLDEHSAPFDALVHVIEGRARIRIGGKERAVEAGEVLRMPANMPHAVRAESRFKMLLTLLKA